MPVKGSWDITEQAMESQGGGTFLRLDGDGDKAVGAFCGPPYVRERCFNEKTNAYEEWNAAAQAAGRKKQTRYTMNFYTVSLKGKPLNEMRVFDMNFQTMGAVIGLRDKYGPGKQLYEITRHGAKGDTKTTYQILPDALITPEMAALFGSPVPSDRNAWNEGSVPLIDLEEANARDEGGAETAVSEDVKKDGKKSAAKPAANGATNHHATPAAPVAAAPAATAATAPPATTAAAPAPSGPTISKEAAAVIVSKLKPLPDPEKGIKLFLQSFPYAKKISEVHLADEAAAVALANQLANPVPAAPEDAFS
jgi:hypothetical protein